MSEKNAHDRALQAFELDDIFIVELTCKIARDFNQAGSLPEVGMQHRFEPENSGLIQTRQEMPSGKEVMIFRYYVDGNVRVLIPDVPANKTDVASEDLLAEIAGVIAVDYRTNRDLREDVEAIGAFGANVVFHAWPYWRAAVLCRAAELRLPRIVLPMMRQPRIKPQESQVSTTAQT